MLITTSPMPSPIFSWFIHSVSNCDSFIALHIHIFMEKDEKKKFYRRFTINNLLCSGQTAFGSSLLHNLQNSVFLSVLKLLWSDNSKYRSKFIWWRITNKMHHPFVQSLIKSVDSTTKDLVISLLLTTQIHQRTWKKCRWTAECYKQHHHTIRTVWNFLCISWSSSFIFCPFSIRFLLFSLFASSIETLCASNVLLVKE